MVQRRAARYVTNPYRNTSSVTSMLGDLEWDILETRRKKIRLTMMYKIINLIDIKAEEYLTKPTRQTRSSHSLKYQQFSASLDTTYNSTTLNLDRGSGQLLFERYQTGSLSNWCWQGIPNTGGLWEETVFVVICGC